MLKSQTEHPMKCYPAIVVYLNLWPVGAHTATN